MGLISIFIMCIERKTACQMLNLFCLIILVLSCVNTAEQLATTPKHPDVIHLQALAMLVCETPSHPLGPR